MQLGFRHAFHAGISFGKDDMVIPAAKEKLVEDTRTLVKDYEQQYQDGLITQQEKYNKVIDAWSRCGDQVASAMMKEISATPKRPDGRQADLNSIYMMAHSGARGSQAQIKQLAGMRGLMAKPSGEIRGLRHRPSARDARDRPGRRGHRLACGPRARPNHGRGYRRSEER
jgi:DNA-directed RNA polymerase subunit beta'